LIILRILLLPITCIYAIIIALRNLLYASGILSRTQFDIPIICIGNLSAGGTGKTPHIEWVIKTFQNEFNMAVLSRGYKRKTSGYLLAMPHHTAADIGDEPLQIKRKFENVPVAVSENRVLGVPELLSDAQDTQCVLMDDGFQHLPIKPGFSILLTDYNCRYTTDWLLPSGRLREFRSGAKRAQCVVVTKCPADLTHQQAEQIKQELNAEPHQPVFFTTIAYSSFVTSVFDAQQQIAVNTLAGYATLVLSGIADAGRFEQFLEQISLQSVALRFSDHQQYASSHIDTICQTFEKMKGEEKMVVTTEKDAVKLTHIDDERLKKLPVYYLPCEVKFLFEGDAIFKKILYEFITKHQGSD
jgi:tetraacyldisaccharide 4'-kinase